MKFLVAVVLLGALAVASATCPNLCSGHGTCGDYDRCTCFSNWQAADCSERVCPYGLAWVDAPSATNTAHAYAECSNQGTCNRETGQCECYPGFEGKGCRRAACPNSCSGHGTCYFMEQLKSENGKMVVDYGNPAENREDKVWYDLWDKSKFQACVCDPYYEGTDCSLRQCPRGDNRLTTGEIVNGRVSAKDQGNTVQEIFIGHGLSDNAGDSLSGEFTLTFTDLYGGEWETNAIHIDTGKIGGGTNAQSQWSTGALAYVAGRIKAELENLPNDVVEGVTVTTIAQGANDGVLGLAAADQDATCAAANTVCIKEEDDTTDLTRLDAVTAGSLLGNIAEFYTKAGNLVQLPNAGGAAPDYGVRGEVLNFKVEFTGEQNSGVQNLLKVNYKGCNYAGCAPRYSGLTGADATSAASDSGHSPIFAYVGDVTEYVASGSNTLMHKEAAVCSEHGLCDTTTGLCQCFSGYYDEDCNRQTVLV